MARTKLNDSADTLLNTIQAIQAMDQETFMKFRQAFVTLDKQRRQEALYAFQPGQKVEFVARGRTIQMMITSLGRKRLLGKELDANGKMMPLRGWRVSPSLCKVVS
jgi:hypothetical protein